MPNLPWNAQAAHHSICSLMCISKGGADSTASNSRLFLLCPTRPLNTNFQCSKKCLSRALGRTFIELIGCSHNPSSYRFLTSHPKLQKRSPNLSHSNSTLIDPSHGPVMNDSLGPAIHLLEAGHPVALSHRAMSDTLAISVGAGIRADDGFIRLLGIIAVAKSWPMRT